MRPRIRKWYLLNYFDDVPQNTIMFYSDEESLDDKLSSIATGILEHYNTEPLRKGHGLSAKFDLACLSVAEKTQESDSEYVEYLTPQGFRRPRTNRTIYFSGNELPFNPEVDNWVSIEWSLVSPEDINSEIIGELFTKL